MKLRCRWALSLTTRDCCWWLVTFFSRAEQSTLERAYLSVTTVTQAWPQTHLSQAASRTPKRNEDTSHVPGHGGQSSCIFKDRGIMTFFFYIPCLIGRTRVKPWVRPSVQIFTHNVWEEWGESAETIGSICLFLTIKGMWLKLVNVRLWPREETAWPVGHRDGP